MPIPSASFVAWLPAGWAEPVTLGVMLACFAALSIWRRWPIGIALVLAAWSGATIQGHLLPIRHLVEGGFAFFDPILVIATAMILMRILTDGGALASVGAAVERTLGDKPMLLLPTLMLIVMFPGMITGSSTASVLTTGAMVATTLIALGLARERAAAFVAIGGVLGMIAPPINIPAMIIGGGLDLPYAGFGLPLATLSFPLAALLAFGLAWPVIRSGRCGTPTKTLASSDCLPALWRAMFGPIVAVFLMVVPRIFPAQVPDPGLPLVFLIGATVSVLVLPKFAIGTALLRATEESLPVLGILFGVGAFIQVMTMTGARGFLVSLMVGAPPGALIATAAIGMPAFGAISAFGSSSVLGVPFLLSLLGRNEVITTAALSALASLGDLMLPAALAPTLAAQVAGVGNRMVVLRQCLLPALIIALAATLMLVFSPALGRWF